MKAKLFVIGLFLFALAACTQRVKVPEPAVAEPSRSVEGPSPELQSIDTQMWHHPDSALMRLLPWFDTCCRDVLNASQNYATDSITRRNHCVSTTFDRHYVNLLLSELLYKNDYPQTNRRELQQAVAYFDSLTVLADTRGVSLQPRPRRDARRASAQNIAFLDARAHYINGVGYYENDSVVEACKEYMKALEVMEGRFKEKELVGHKAQFMAYTYTRLTELFSNLYLQEQAIYFARCSITYYQKQEVASWHTIFMLNNIGSQFDMMNQLDSAAFYYHKAMKALDDTTTLLSRDIAAHLICLEYKRGICLADATTKRLRNLLQDSESARESQSRYMYIGEVFYHERRYDSAWIYLNTVFQTTSVVGLKRQAAEWLIEICKIQGRDDDILEYADFLAPFANQEENQSAIKSQLTELYKTICQSQHERQHEKEMQRHRSRSMAVIAGLFLVILVVLALYRNNKRRKQHLEKQIKEEKQTHSMEKKALSSRLKKSNETLRELQDQIKKQDRDSLKPETSADTFVDEPICRLILERVSVGQFKSKVDYLEYKSYALSKQQLIDLRVAVDQHFDKFTIRLKKTYPQLTNGDLDYCCLYLLGLTDADIAALMQRTYSTVSDRSRKLKTVFESPDTLSVTLHCIANKEITI